MKSKPSELSANLMLLAAAMIWGAGFVVMKSTLSALPPNAILAMRFSIGAFGLGFIIRKSYRTLSFKTLLRSVVLGAVLYAAFALQTYGLERTSAGHNAFITAVYVVLVPIFVFAFKRTKPSAQVFAAAIICFAGIFILSFDSTDSASGSSFFGDMLTLACGVLFALHIVLSDIYMSRGENVMVMTAFQFLFAALFAWTFSVSFEDLPSEISGKIWLALAYSGIASTLLGLLLQNIGIKYASASYASLILCTESVFGVIFGVIFFHEALTFKLVLGCGIILLSLVLANLKLGRRSRHKTGGNRSL